MFAQQTLLDIENNTKKIKFQIIKFWYPHHLGIPIAIVQEVSFVLQSNISYSFQPCFPSVVHVLSNHCMKIHSPPWSSNLKFPRSYKIIVKLFFKVFLFLTSYIRQQVQPFRTGIERIHHHFLPLSSRLGWLELKLSPWKLFWQTRS